MSDVTLLPWDGGPGGGKSTSMSAAREKAIDYGHDAYVASEVATDLILAGMQLKSAVHAKRWSDLREYQKIIMTLQYAKENALLRAAEIASKRTGRPAVVLCDRALPSNRAYFEDNETGFEMYQAVLKETTGLNHQEAQERYKGVIHLVTAADGAEEFYTCENNAARDEPPELARYLDLRIKKAWNGHPHFIPIDNSTDFAKKKHRAIQGMCRILGVPEPLEIERKYLVAHPCLAHFPVHFVSTAIEQTYLHPANPDEEVRIRRRTVGDSSTFYLTRKKEVRPGVRNEFEKMIEWREYYDLLETRDPQRGTIKKNRITFLYNNQYFELDIFKNLVGPLCLLEVELSDVETTIEFPLFLTVGDDVTDNPDYKNHKIALRVRKAAQ